MSASSILPSPADQLIAQSLIAAAQAAFEHIDQTVKPPPGIEIAEERGAYNYTIEPRSHGMSYAMLFFNLERTVIRALTLSRIVAAAARHVQQVTLVCRPTSSNNNNTTTTTFEFRHVFYIRVDVFCDAYFDNATLHVEIPQYSGVLVRTSVARHAMNQFADQHHQQPQAGVPTLHPNFKRDHVPVLANIIEIIQNMDPFLPRLEWRVFPTADESAQYSIAVWNIHKITYDVLEYLYARIGAPIQDVRFEQTFDDSIAVLVIEVDVSSARTSAPAVAGAIACRQRVQMGFNRTPSKLIQDIGTTSDEDGANGLRKRKRDDVVI